MSYRLSSNAQAPAELGLSHLVSANFFDVLGAKPLLGRTFDTSEASGQEATAVVSYRFWQESLGGDAGALGRAIRINGTSFALIGVMPPRFYGVSLDQRAPDFWLPLAFQPEVMLQPSLLAPHALYWLHLMGRRNPEAPLARIQAWMTSQLQAYMMDREGPQVSETRRREIRGIFVPALPGDRGISDLRDRYSEPLKVLMGIVVLVLLIACANLANFLLARASSREREFATRLALGSAPARIVRSLLTEALLLALAGGCLGLLFSYFVTRGLIKFVAAGALHTALSAVPDTRILLFTLGVSVLTGLLFGLAPALRIRRLSVAPAEQASARGAAGSGGRSRFTLPKLLTASQVILSLTLVSSTGLFARTLHNLEKSDFGFNRHRLLLVSFGAKFAGYKPEQVYGLYDRMLEAVAALPGVRSASVSGTPPINAGRWNSPIYFTGNVAEKKDTSTLLERIGPHYFETVSIPVLRGRTIGRRDTLNALKVAVVNKAAADYFFPNGDAIGRVFTVADPSVKGAFQIIGIVGNSIYRSPRTPQERMVYLPVAQLTGDDAYAYCLEIQTSGEPAGVIAEVRRALAGVDPNLPIVDVKTIAEQTQHQLANEILVSRLSGFFSLLALSLACIGLYGIMTYNVLRRSGEIGIRMTLGAQSGTVLWMVLSESLMLLAVGIAVGLPATLAVTRLFQSQLFGLSPWDPVTLLGAVLTISAVVLVSAWFPARRATRVDPLVTLRYQ